jgi:arylsulfatase A-like enzyme
MLTLPRPLNHRTASHCALLLGWIATSSCAPRPAPDTSATPHATLAPSAADKAPEPSAPHSAKRRVILFVWDGLRPDSIDPALTPQLARLRDERGVNFREHHAVYPTFTMMNAAAFATGARSGSHGFYGNIEYQPGPVGTNARGGAVDYAQPVFSEDHRILQTLDAFYRARGSALLRVETLFEVAHAAGLRTAVIGKAGPAFLQDYRQTGETGVILDENVVLPRAFALSLQAAGMPLPRNTTLQSYEGGVLTLQPDNGDPSAASEPALVTLADGVTPDPRAAGGSPHNARNAYLMRVFTQYVLPELDPQLSVIWLRNPDSTQHSYGPGSPNALDALRHQDQLLAQLLAALDRLGRSASTDVLIASDHGHSTIAADSRAFPARALDGEPDGHARVGAIASPGYSVSGDVRSADWLRRAGFAHVYDGGGCVFDPGLGGLNARAEAQHPTQQSAACEKQPRFSTPSYRVPQGPLPLDAIVIAANGGSEYFYVPSQAPRLLRRLVSALHERTPYGPIFVRARYGRVPGTLPLAQIGMETPDSISPPTPDLVVSFDWDATAISAAARPAPGTLHSSPQSFRGMHGSFSPVDVHNTLIAIGPDFRSGFLDSYPSSTLDVAPTIAALLSLSLPHAEGRVLDEAFAREPPSYRVEPFSSAAEPVALRQLCESDDLDCKHPRRGATYAFSLRGQTLSSADGTRHYTYLDDAKVTRALAAKRP